MTTHDQRTEAIPSPEEVEPAAARTEHREEHAASSTVAAKPSTAQTESTVSAGEPSAAAPTRCQTKPHRRPPIPNRQLRRPNRRSRILRRRLRRRKLRRHRPNHQLRDRCSPTPSSPVFVRAGTTCRPDSSTIPNSASTKPTAWCPMWSTSSRPASPKRVHGSRNSGPAANRLPPKTFASP